MITVSIVTYKTDLVEPAKCLTSLLSPLISKVYIIDNSSNDVDWAHRVIPETVGQFTGVADKNGKRVFEGDIFQYEPHFKTEKAWIGIVKYRNTYDYYRACNDCGFVIEWQDESIMTPREDLLYWCGDGKSASVIGNVYDDPELLEE